MSTTSDKVINDALELPADMRLNLVDKILTSLNLPTRPDIDRQWAEEAEKRISELDEGKVELIPDDDVFAFYSVCQKFFPIRVHFLIAF